MAVVCGPHTLRTAGRDAHLDGAGSLRAHALVRRVGEPAQQHRHGDLLRGRQGAGNLLRAEPFLRAVRGAVRLGLGDPHLDQRPRSAADRRGAHRHRGRPLRLAFGHRHPVAHPRRGEDDPLAEPFGRRRIDHHAAAGQEPLPARHGTPPERAAAQRQARAGEIQGVDHGPQTRIQLHQGGDRRDVPQHRGVRIERLRHQVGGAHLLQQNARPAQLAGGRRARRRGQRTDALLAGAQLRQRHGPSQPRARAHGRSGRHHARRARLALGAAHYAQLPPRLAQRRAGDLLPRDAAAGDERPAPPSAATSTPNGITSRPSRSTRTTRSTAGATRTRRPTARPTTSTRTG